MSGTVTLTEKIRAYEERIASLEKTAEADAVVNAQLHERIRELEEKLTKAAITATRTREEWRAWLEDDSQQFPPPEFLDSISALIEAVGVNAHVGDDSAEE